MHRLTLLSALSLFFSIHLTAQNTKPHEFIQGFWDMDSITQSPTFESTEIETESIEKGDRLLYFSPNGKMGFLEKGILSSLGDYEWLKGKSVTYLLLQDQAQVLTLSMLNENHAYLEMRTLGNAMYRIYLSKSEKSGLPDNSTIEGNYSLIQHYEGDEWTVYSPEIKSELQLKDSNFIWSSSKYADSGTWELSPDYQLKLKGQSKTIFVTIKSMQGERFFIEMDTAFGDFQEMVRQVVEEFIFTEEVAEVDEYEQSLRAADSIAAAMAAYEMAAQNYSFTGKWKSEKETFEFRPDGTFDYFDGKKKKSGTWILLTSELFDDKYCIQLEVDGKSFLMYCQMQYEHLEEIVVSKLAVFSTFPKGKKLVSSYFIQNNQD